MLFGVKILAGMWSKLHQKDIKILRAEISAPNASVNLGLDCVVIVSSTIGVI